MSAPAMIDALFIVRAAKEKRFIRMAVVAPRLALKLAAEANNFSPAISAAAVEYWKALTAAGPFEDDISAWKASEKILADQGSWIQFGVTDPVDLSAWESDSARISNLIKEIRTIAVACTILKNVQSDPDFQRVLRKSVIHE